MTNAKRSTPPPVQAVPWGQVPVGSGSHEVLPQFAEPMPPVSAPDSREQPEPHVVRNARPESSPSIFDPDPIPRKSVFAPTPKAREPEKSVVHPLTDCDPSWLELVQFCQKHGDSIIQARYPQPRGECIDTIYRGVTVFEHPSTQVRHQVHGWIDWQDAIY